MDRIICHWTAGASKPNAVDFEHYHFLIDGDGVVHSGKHKPEDNLNCKDGRYAAHTLNCNTGSIGVALCGMAGAVESPFDAGKHPINKKQWSALVKLIASLSRKYKIGITAKTVLSHAEVQANLNITQRGKWDISRLPWDNAVVGALAVGNKLRREVLAEMMGTAPVPAATQPAKPVAPTPQKAAIKGVTSMTKDMVFALARHLLTFGGGYVVAKGLLDQVMVNELIGAVLTIAGVAWSAADKKARA